MTPEQRERQRAQARVWERRKRRRLGVPQRPARVVGPRHYARSYRREEFAAWLEVKVAAYGVGYVARRIGTAEHVLHAIRNGYDTSGHNLRGGGRRKLRAVDYVTIDLVDRALMAFDEHTLLDSICPPQE